MCRLRLSSSTTTTSRGAVMPRTVSLTPRRHGRSGGASYGGAPMTSLPNRPNTAVVVIDVQNGVVEGAPRRDEVIANINAVVDRARAADVPGDLGAAPERRAPRGQRAVAVRAGAEDGATASRWSTSATATPSRTPRSRTSWRRAGVGRLIVTGAQTDACVRSTLHGAFTRGYDTTLVSDAHTTEDLTEYGAPPVGAGDRPHQPLLVLPGRPRIARPRSCPPPRSTSAEPPGAVIGGQ